MKQKNRIHIRTLQGRAKVLLVIVSGVLLSQVLGDNQGPRPSRMDPVSDAHKQGIAKGLAGNFGLGPFQASLEMKENADFLLTPALLVQEALSDDIIMTYPSE